MILKITNFQKHKSFELDLSEPVTTIVGKSDSGKSAIVRALRWLCTNRPSGESFIRKGAKNCQVELELDGHTIIRGRGNENLYQLDDQTYKAFGNDVPTEIAKILNVGPVNFQGQHDPIFWFSKSAGEVSKELNAIVNLDLIDKVLANVASELRKTKTAVELSKERLESSRIERDRLAWTESANSELEALEGIGERLKECQDRKDKLTTIVKRVGEYQKTFQDASNAAVDARNVVSVGDKANELGKRIAALGSLVEGIKERASSIFGTRSLASVIEKEIEKEKICPLCGKPKD